MSEKLWRKNLINIEPYVAGEQPKNDKIIKLNANENPYPPSSKVKAILEGKTIAELRKYPSADASALRTALAERVGLKSENVFCGNGSDDVLATAFRAAKTKADEKLVGNNYSVWSFTAGVLQKYNEPFTDVGEMLRYTAANAGGASFGKIRNCTTGETVQSYIKLLWQPLLPIAQKSAGRGELHIVFGLCIQKAMMTCKSAVSLSECARIIMESALTGARVDFKDL